MICPKFFIDELVARGLKFFTGVPCSYLTPLINETLSRQDTHYAIASSEGEALALASGAWLSGRTVGVVMCQNSGLGNMINPLTSLNAPFGIPVLLLITWRGKPGEIDEPQHEVMGRVMPDLLNLLGIPSMVLSKEESATRAVLDEALDKCQQSNKPFALIIEKDSFICQETTGEEVEQEIPSRAKVLETLLHHIPQDCPIIATTGKTGRELYTLKDAEQHLYCVGSMGYANALAHGLALNSEKKVYVIDGDGAAIMHLGNLTSIGLSGVKNLIHIILDNGTYDSTGGQQTASSVLNFTELAKNCGYKEAINCSSLIEFTDALKAPDIQGPRLIYMRINQGSMQKLGRPTITPHNVARRLRNFMQTAV